MKVPCVFSWSKKVICRGICKGSVFVGDEVKVRPREGQYGFMLLGRPLHYSRGEKEVARLVQVLSLPPWGKVWMGAL